MKQYKNNNQFSFEITKKLDGKNIEGQTLYLLFLSFGQQFFVPSLSPEAFKTAQTILNISML